MGTFEALERFIDKTTPSFRKARRKRNEIKTKYHKNIRDIESENRLVILAGYETHLLGNNLETEHRKLESKIKQEGEYNYSAKTRYRNGEEAKEFLSKDGQEDEVQEIKTRTQEMVNCIKRRNKISLLLEILTYSVFAIFILLIVAMLTDNLHILLG